MAHQQIIMKTPRVTNLCVCDEAIISHYICTCSVQTESCVGRFSLFLPLRILALCLEKGSYYCVDIRFQHR